MVWTRIRNDRPEPARRHRPGVEVLDERCLLSTGAGTAALLGPKELARARDGVVIVQRRRADGPALRLLARSVSSRGERAVLVVGESLAQRERALDALHAMLNVLVSDLGRRCLAEVVGAVRMGLRV